MLKKQKLEVTYYDRTKNQNLEGLTSEQAKKLQEQFGKNELATVKTKFY